MRQTAHAVRDSLIAVWLYEALLPTAYCSPLKRGGNVCDVWPDISMFMLLNTFLRILPWPWKIALAYTRSICHWGFAGGWKSSSCRSSTVERDDASKPAEQKPNIILRKPPKRVFMRFSSTVFFRLVTRLNQKATHGEGRRLENTSIVVSVQIKFRRKSLIRN